ncbi:MAG: replication initiator protein A [Actinobacteria bacterium]|nr:replication initiator protein A [Actinomycetota bacterium]
MKNRENISKKPGLSSNNSNGYLNNKEYNSIPSNRFYTAQEEITIRFYQVPKALFKNPVYKGLDLGPKLMYSVLRDRLDLSIKNNWKDEKGYIYLIFSVEELASLLEIDRTAVMRYKKKLVEYNLIIDKRLGQGNPNRIYVLKPELSNSQKSQNTTSRSPKKGPLEVPKCNPNDTYFNETNLDNVNRAGREEVVENSENEMKEYPKPNRYRSREKELLAKEIAEELNDNHSLGAFRIVVDKISEQQIRIFLSIVKDTHLTGKIKKSRGAMFVSLAKAYAAKNNINLNFK